MAVCNNCGKNISEDAKFCSECGASMNKDVDENNRRHQEYTGKIFKCPNCGEILNAFMLVCPVCGFEIRGAKSSSGISEFVSRLQAIEAQRETPKKKRTNNNGSEISKTDKQKINLIRSFPIPNTKEDLLEFLILALSNINEKPSGDIEKEMSNAWRTKFEQAYSKAKVSLKGTSDFQEIQSLYEQKMEKIIRAKQKDNTESWIIVVVLWAILLGGLFGLFFIDNRKIKSENERLEIIVDDIYECIEQEKYDLARINTAKLVFLAATNTSAGEEAVEHWENVRKEMYILIDKAEGVELDEASETQENISISDVGDENETIEEQSSSEGIETGISNKIEEGINSIGAFWNNLGEE